MASQVLNIAKGRVKELYNRVKSNDPANSAIIVIALKVAESDAALIDYADLAALLAAAGNTECDFTNYARTVFTDVELAALPSPDNAADTSSVDIPDITYTDAGGTVDNTLVKMIVCYDSDTTLGDDSNIVPMTHNSFAVDPTTSGLTLTIQSTDFFSAS